MANLGLSILIPVYNCDVTTLVTNLHQQASSLPIPFEIRIYDDDSALYKAENKLLNKFSYTTFLELDKNIGRSKIRNKLADESLYSHLLFLDCDSGVRNNSFLKDYLKHFEHPIVVGGRNYLPSPVSKDYTLHWNVGNAKEVRPLEERRNYPYKSFMSNNFLIQKVTYQAIKLDENIIGYGHEDTKFGYELERAKIKVWHIDNPVFHLQLDTNTEFIRKTNEGLKNLYHLFNLGFATDTKLGKVFYLIKSLKIISAVNFIYAINEKRILKNLNSDKPSMKLFDLYKLNKLIEIYKANKHN